MSADNFNFVRRIQDKWHVWLNLSASCERGPQLARPADRAFGCQEEAVAWADEQGYTEYGTEVDDRPPADALFDLIIQEFDQRFIELAEELGISNEELEQAAAEIGNGDPDGIGAAYAYFCRHVITHRRVAALTALIRPGELDDGGCVSLRELVDREARTKASS